MVPPQANSVTPLSQRLGALPDSHLPEFDFAAIALINDLRPSIDDLLILVGQPGGGPNFKAFCVSMTLLWRNRDFERFRNLLSLYEPSFVSEPMFKALEAQAALTTSDVFELRSGLVAARAALALMPNRTYVIHTFAHLILEIADHGEATADELTEAEAAIRRALRLHPEYAKYHGTHARLLSYRGKYEEALAEAMTAIDKEPSNGLHYALRVGDYQDIRLSIAYRQQSDKLSSQVVQFTAFYESMRSELTSLRSELLQVMGLLAAIIAFIVTGSQIAASMKPATGILVMAAVGLAIVLAFSSLSLIFGRSTNRTSSIWLMCTSTTVLAGLYVLARIHP
ncbi:MAG: hypothetical protein JWM34_3050 [Ilumatobacteraceae bacterium]|nr:hypothetical protein [Ilumatobacteraceae bacterium]